MLKVQSKKFIRKLLKENKNTMTYDQILQAMEDSGITDVKTNSIKNFCKKELDDNGDVLHYSIKSKVNSRYLTDAEKAHIDDNHSSKLIATQAEEMGRSAATVRKYYRAMGYDTNAVLSEFSQNYIKQHYKCLTLTEMSRRLSIKEDKIVNYFFDNPDTLDMRLINTEGFNEGEPYVEKTQNELDSMSSYQRHIHQIID